MIDWDKAVLGPVMGVFGNVEVEFSPVGESSFPVTGIFDEAYLDVTLADGIGIPTTGPVLGSNLSQFIVRPRRNDTFIISKVLDNSTSITPGDKFIVKEVRSDGHGSVKLMLNFAG